MLRGVRPSCLRRLFLGAFALDAFSLAKALARAFRLLVLIAADCAALLAAVNDGVARMPILVPSSTVSHFHLACLLDDRSRGDFVDA
jgi:hypothetical protein